MLGFRKEPVAIIAVINASIACAVEFGFHLTPGQQTSIIVLANALLAVFLRSQVASEHALTEAGTSVKQVVAVAKSDVDARLEVVGNDASKVKGTTE